MNGCVVKDINDSGIYIGVPVKKNNKYGINSNK